MLNTFLLSFATCKQELFILMVFYWSFDNSQHVKFIYSEKATKFCEISILLLFTVHTDKRKVEISQNFVVFSEYMNFTLEVDSW